MPMRVRPLLLVLACGLVPAREAVAQSHRPLAVDVSTGVTVGSGGTYVARGGAAIEAVVAHRLRQTSAGMLVAGVTLGAQTPVAVDDSCLLLPDGGCAPTFPVFYSAGALLGVQRGSPRTASARFMAGPVYYRADDDGGALGVRGLVDVATPPRHHLALVASLRHTVLPSFRNQAVGITSLGLGLRIQ